MNSEKNLNCLVSLLLAQCLAMGSLGCLISGVKLPVADTHGLWMTCFFCAVAASVCYRFRWGGWVLRLLTAAGLIWFLQDPQRLSVLLEQARVAANRVTKLWNGAYGWRVISLRSQTVCDWVLMLYGGYLTVAVSRTVSRRKGCGLPVLTALGPLCLCLVVTDTVPEERWLFLLLLGLAVLALTDRVRRMDLRQSLKLTGLAAAGAAAALTALLGLCPQEAYVNRAPDLQGHLVNLAQELPAQVKEWGQDLVSRDVQTVQSAKENLDSLGDRSLREYTVLEVRSTVDGVLYLRGQDFDVYDGKSWTASRNRTEEFRGGARYPTCWEARENQVTITTRTAKDIRYVPYYPAESEILAGGKRTNGDGILSYNYNVRTLHPDWQTQLLLSSQFYPETDSQGDLVHADATALTSSASKQTWRNLPIETGERAKELVAQILTGEENYVTDKALAIRDYVQSSGVYSLTPEKMPGDQEDFALWFLENADSGYCVHFATAATVLLRAAGIEARYVTGYVCRTVAGKTVKVPAAQAHAWAEYYEPALGVWMVLEATPSEEFLGEAEVVEDAGDAVAETTLPTETATEAATGPEIPDFTQPSQSAGPTDGGELPDAGETSPAGLPGLLTGLLWTALALGALWGQYRLRRWLRSRHWTHPDPNIRALALWREAERLYRLKKCQPPARLEQLAQRAKYSQHILTEEELGAFHKALREATAALKKENLCKLLIYRFIFAAY